MDIDQTIEMFKKAEVGSRELDVALYNVIVGTPWGAVEWDDGEPYADYPAKASEALRPVPRFSTNLQDAVDAIPEGWKWEMQQTGYAALHGDETHGWVTIEEALELPCLALCVCILKAQQDNIRHRQE